MELKAIFLAPLLLVYALVFSQETIEIVSYYKDSKQVKERYFVLADNHEIKHGIFTSYYYAHKTDDNEALVQHKGQYFQNQKHGIWYNYKPPMSFAGMSNGIGELVSRSHYTHGAKTGVWETIHELGKVVKRFNYDDMTELNPKINIIPKYPVSMLDSHVEGAIRVLYNITPTCELEKVEFVTSISPEFDASVTQTLDELGGLLNKYGGEECIAETVEQTFNFKMY